jgi:hypothetical protein
MAIGTNGPPVLNGSAYVYPQKTLKQLRDRIIIRLGWGAQLASPPPGVAETVNDFLQSAHEELYQRYPILRQQKWFSIAVTQGNRFYDVPYTGAYYEASDIAFNSASPDTIVNTSGDFVAAGFTAGMRISVSGSDSNDGYHTLGATVSANSMDLTTSTTVTTEAAGALIRITEDDFDVLDLREITDVGLLDGTIWNSMIAGIDPMLFNIDQQSRPSHFEIREYVEVFPEPDQAYTLYLKGRVSIRPFTADAHVSTVDPHVVFLNACANAKAHYGQPDARVYWEQLEALIGNLNAGSFAKERFIPEPEPDLPSLPTPKVTFPRP